MRYQIVHPYDDKIDYIYVTLDFCTTYRGVPYGLAYIRYSVSDNHLSFRGVGYFIDGKLHMTPFTCKNGNGFVY